MATVSMTVNGKTVTKAVDPRTLLVEFLRENLRLTGTHVGCDTSQCGACVVHVEGRAIKSCTALALSCEGAKVTTIEGLANGGTLHPMQEAFREHHALAVRLSARPGMIMAAVDIVTAQRAGPRRAHDPRGARRQHLPLHRLPQHRQGDCCRRRRHGQRPSGRRIVGRTPMTATGIGASVRRKEDHRFITGKGQYVDDINRPGQSYAVFRALAACARHDQEDRHQRGRSEAPGVVGIFTGDDLAADKVGGLICGWMIHSKDGSPMKAGAASGAGAGQGALCRRSCGGRHRRDAGAGARRGRAGRGRLRRAAARASISPRRKPTGSRRCTPRRPNNTGLCLAPGRQGRGRCGLRQAEARHQDRPRQQPPDPQRHRAARGHRRVR